MPFSIRPHRRLPLAYFSGFWLLITLLVLSSSPAHAEWVWISFTRSEGGYDVYTDPETLRRKGDLVKMWVPYDYKTMQLVTSLAYMSESAQLQANAQKNSNGGLRIRGGRAI